MPKRIQRRRTKGWTMPEGAVYVGRPTVFGNNFSIEEYGRYLAIFNFRQRMRNMQLINPRFFDPLRGKDLACWCHLCDKHKDGKPLGVECAECDPCHVDILLEISNS